MTTFNTRDKLGSAAAKNLFDNAENLDFFTNDRNAENADDRFGNKRLTWHGIEQQSQRAMSAYGYITKKSFELGNTLDTPNAVLQWAANGEFYRWDGAWSGPKVVPAGSTPMSTGGAISPEKPTGDWTSVGDASLRGDLGLVTKRYPGYNAMLSDPSLKVGDSVCSGNGVWEVLRAPASSVGDFRIKSMPSLYDFGAVGGDPVADTLAIRAAVNLGVPCLVPAVPLSRAFVVSGIIDLPLKSSLIGDCDGLIRMSSPAHDSAIQPYIKFKDENSRFAGGRGAEDRVSTKWSNIAFVSSAGIRPLSANVKGMAIGPIDDNPLSKSAIGGKMHNVAFYGFRRAFQNDWAYFFDISSVDVLNCYDGLIFDDWNSSSISNFYSSEVANSIDTGPDSANSAVRNIGINVGAVTEIAMKIDAGVKLEGHNYFESFGTVFKKDSTCLAYHSSYWSNRAMSISHVLFDAECDYHITIDSTTPPQESIPSVFQVKGDIKGVHSARAPRVARIGYGIHKTRGGNPTYPSLAISNFDLSTCSGITAADLRAPDNSPYRTMPCTPYFSLYSAVETPIPVQTAYTRIPLPELTNDNTNAINTVIADGRELRVPVAGVYTCTANITISNTLTEIMRTCELQLLVDGRLMDSTVVSVAASPGSGVRSYAQATLSFTASISRGSRLLLQGRNGGSVYRLKLNLQKISDGQ